MRAQTHTPPTVRHNAAPRIAALCAIGIIDTLPEPTFDRLGQHIAAIRDVPISAVVLVDGDRQWFKADTGVDVTETPHDVSFCAPVMTAPQHILIVAHATTDRRLAGELLVIGDLGLRYDAVATGRKT